MATIHNFPLLPSTSDHAGFVELRLFFPSQTDVISRFADRIMGFIAKFRKVDGREGDIEVALREALANAIVHGNHEDPRKHVYVVCRCTRDGDVWLTVKDEGEGFDNARVPDPTALENRWFTSGRGIYLMKTLMGEIRFEEGGTVASMRKDSHFGLIAERRSA